MTPAQVLAIKQAIAADPVMAAASPSDDGSDLIASMFNIVQPAYIVWKTAVEADAIMRNGMDWARVDNLSVGKARIWDWLTRLGTINASKPNVRGGIDATWVGTAADLAVRAQVYTHCKRPATRLEKLLATGTGTAADPATMGYEGNVGYAEISAIRNAS